MCKRVSETSLDNEKNAIFVAEMSVLLTTAKKKEIKKIWLMQSLNGFCEVDEKPLDRGILKIESLVGIVVDAVIVIICLMVVYFIVFVCRECIS